MTSFGAVLLYLSLFGSVFAIGAFWIGDRMGHKHGAGTTRWGYTFTFIVTGLISAAALVLIVSCLREDWSFRYIVMNRSTDVSSLGWLFKLSVMWAGREGSLLLWAWLLSLFTAWIAFKRRASADRLSNIGLAVAGFLGLFFIVALLVPTNNPFLVSPAEWLDATTGVPAVAMASSPLLQHWAMILHPPALFIGYAGLAIPFAFAIAALIVGDTSKKWVEIVNRVTVFSWLFLGIGIGLGAVWAYIVLGWGGYWAWDPVENASLLPWLTGVALLHSFTVYRKRDGFRRWAIMMSSVTFVLVLLGTFITRSGIISSVHAFEADPISLWLFLSMMVLCLVVPAVGVLLRRDLFKVAEEWESLTSKDASYYFNNAIMLTSAVIIAGMTTAPAWLPGMTFGAASFDLLARPFGILYIGLMAICPILSWRKTDAATFWSRVKWPLGIGAFISAGFIAIWVTVMLPNYELDAKRASSLHGIAGILPAMDHIEAFIGLLICGLAIAMPLYLFTDGARKRSASTGDAFPVALWKIMTKARQQSGGYITHLGMGIIMVGLIGSAMYTRDIPAESADANGSKFTAAGYEFVVEGVDQRKLKNGDVETAVTLDLRQGGRSVGTVHTGQIKYLLQDQVRLNADVHSEIFKDVFVAFQGADTGKLYFDVKINPMISWVWAGFMLTILGGTLAVWPKRQAEPQALAAGSRRGGKAQGRAA